jgi:uncharacterized membrane protein YphA (DoxX/SURF4 family)
MPHGVIIRIFLFAMSGLILLGLFSQLVGLFSLIIFIIGFHVFGYYLLTYFNYLGEIITLLLFGTFIFSLDKILLPELRNSFQFIRKYEPTILRVFYGIALAYAAVNIKLLHPVLTVDVANIYHLNRFSWLFPPDPLLTTMGAGLAELAIGAFIIFGFQTRFVVLISLFYITLSLIFFREAVWPHLMLYGLSINLLINNGGPLSFDNFFKEQINKRGGLRNIISKLWFIKKN